MARRLQIAFDTSVLGYAAYGAGGRTGVFRMVDCFARSLAQSSECDLFFCGAENLRMWAEARRYLENEEVFRKVPILSYSSPARVYGFLSRWFDDLAKEADVPLPRKLTRRVLKETLRAVESNYTPLDARAIVGKDIYHSSYYGLPEFTKDLPDLKRFLTVCDVINILRPQYSQDSGAFLKSILSTLGPEDRIITLSDFSKADLLTVVPGLAPDRVSVVPLAAAGFFRPIPTEERMPVLERYGISSRPYFVSVATLDPRKNGEGLVRAFAAWLRQEHVEDTDLVLCGHLGQSAATMAKLIQRLGVSKRVKILGYVPDADLPALYSGALAFAYPSFLEGFGLPVLEAMACEIPVITSQGSSLEEIASGAALLAEPNRIDSIAARLDAVYRNPLLRQILVEAGKERVAQYSWEKSTHLLLEAYRSAL